MNNGLNIYGVARWATIIVAFLLTVVLLVSATGCAGTRIVSPVFSIPAANRTTYSYDMYVTVVNNTGYVCGQPVLGRVLFHGNIVPDGNGRFADGIVQGGAPTVRIRVQQYRSTREELVFLGYIIAPNGKELHVGYDTKELQFEGYERLRYRRYSLLRTGDTWAPQVRVPRGFKCS